MSDVLCPQHTHCMYFIYSPLCFENTLPLTCRPAYWWHVITSFPLQSRLFEGRFCGLQLCIPVPSRSPESAKHVVTGCLVAIGKNMQQYWQQLWEEELGGDCTEAQGLQARFYHHRPIYCTTERWQLVRCVWVLLISPSLACHFLKGKVCSYSSFYPYI